MTFIGLGLKKDSGLLRIQSLQSKGNVGADTEAANDWLLKIPKGAQDNLGF